MEFQNKGLRNNNCKFEIFWKKILKTHFVELKKLENEIFDHIINHHQIMFQVIL